MKKRTKLLVMMLLGVLLSINQVWGDEKTHTFSSFTATNGVATITDNPLTIVLDKETNSTPPAWVSSASEARLYAAGTLTISCEQTITKIVYNYAINANKSGVSPTIDGVSGATNAGTWNAETKTWTGSDTRVTFSTSGSAGNVGFTSIIVTYSGGSTYTDLFPYIRHRVARLYRAVSPTFRCLIPHVMSFPGGLHPPFPPSLSST